MGNLCDFGSLRPHNERLRLHQFPVNPDDSLVCETLKRLWKDQIACAFMFLESGEAESCAAIAFLDRHHPVILDEALKMAVSRRFLPQSINFRLTGLVDDLGKTGRFHL